MPELRREFDRQVENLRKGYPGLAGLPEDAFVEHVAPLAQRLGELSGGEDLKPFAIVVTGGLVPAAAAMPLVELRGRTGFTDMDPDDLARFTPIDGVDVPPGPAYLIGDLDTGHDMLNVTPDAAADLIAARNRSPLTIDEGVAFLTHHSALKLGNSFSLLGSRCGDRRVTALWVSGGRPRLGWCWAGNPHTWLGSASWA